MPIINLSNLQQFTAVQFNSDAGSIGGPVVVPNCIQVVFNWALSGGKTAHNVLYGRTAGVPSPTQAQADALYTALFGSAAFTALRANFSTSTSITGLTLRSVHIADQAVIPSTAAAVVGTDAGLALPNEVALAITLRTAKTGKANRGRLYIPGWSGSFLASGNVVAAGAVTNLQGWANIFITQFAANGMTLVIGQKARQAYTGTTGTPHPARQAGSVDVTSLTVRDNRWDSQRRRGLK